MTGPGVLFLLLLALSVAGGAAGAIHIRPRADLSHGVEANERITALTGSVLLVLTAAIGITILRIGDLLPEHYLVGFLMLGPLSLKLASTGYRFIRYYARDPAYREAGPPRIVSRLSAPVLVLATIALFATGVELWLFAYRFGSWWFQAHVVSFLIWTAALGVHLLVHTRRSAEAAWQEVGQIPRRGDFSRRGLVIGSLLLGAVLAVVSLLYVSPFQLPGASG